MDGLEITGLVLIGLVVGALSGVLGIGGGVLVIPLLVMLFGFDQRRAVGTSLAMLLPPIGVFAVLRYYHAGQVDVRAAALMAAGFAAGAWLGSGLAERVPAAPLRVAFCLFLLYVVANMLFRSERRVWAAGATIALAAGYGLAYLALRALGRRWERDWSPREAYRARIEQPVPIDYEI